MDMLSFLFVLFDCFKHIKLWGTGLGLICIMLQSLIKTLASSADSARNRKYVSSSANSNQLVVAAGESWVLRRNRLHQEAALRWISYVCQEHAYECSGTHVIALSFWAHQ